MSGLTLLAELHGALGVLCAALCVHPALTLKSGRPVGPRVRWSVDLAAIALLLTVGLGWWLYGDYRTHVRPWLLENHPAVHRFGFELKEALGFFALVNGLAAAAAIRWAGQLPASRRFAKLAFGLCSAGAIGAGVLGIVTAAFRHL